jgi:tetratricopeptide (TPR) repeat protein
MKRDSLKVARRAHRLLELNKPDAVLDLVSSAIASDPDNATLHALMGEALQRSGRHEEALRAAARVLALDPENVYAHWLRAEVFWWTHRYEEREASFRAALAIDPLDVQCLTGLAGVLADRGREEEAYALSQQAIDAYPDDAWVWQCRSYVADRFGDWEESERCARKALELEPQHPILHSNLGSSLAGQNRAGEAIECFERALELDPNLDVALVSLARTLKSIGRYEEGWRIETRMYKAALQQRDQEVRINPTVTTRTRRARIVGMLEGFDEGHAEAKRALEADPDSLEAKASLASYELLQGDRAAALAALGTPEEWEAEEPRRLTGLVQISLYLDAPEYIETAMRRIKEISPRHENRRLAEALAALAQGRWAEAEAGLRQEDRPVEAQCCRKVALGIARFEQGHVAEAAELADASRGISGGCGCFQIRSLETRLERD